jgi:hypothetical protein
MVARGVLLAGLVLACACALVVSQASASTALPVPDTPIPGKMDDGFLAQCAALPEGDQVDCYVKQFLQLIDRSGNPATELPRIDALVHAQGGFIQAACHPLMHIVGRDWAKQHHLTLADLYRYVPRSNDPGCSAGFGMGMAMYLGPELVVAPRSVLKTCDRLPTRFRRYTCVHGSGHAFMRGFHSQLSDAVRACRTLGPTNAPDCAQGAYHDYWISLGGGDDTTRPKDAATTPEAVCGGVEFVRPCWYRFFWEREPGTHVRHASDMLRLCKGIAGFQRAGCMSGASLMMSRELEPVDHARECAKLSGTDTLNCLRGVDVPLLVGNRFEELRLIDTCSSLPLTTRWGCFSWFGRTLTVVTDGRFRRVGCSALGTIHERVTCVAGAERMNEPLRTFS